MVELMTVGHEIMLEMKELAEGVLHRADVRTDRDLPAGLAFEVLGRRQVIGMGMGLEDPVEVQIMVAQIGEHPIGRAGAGAPRAKGVVENRVDDRSPVAGMVPDHIRHGGGARIEEGLAGRLAACARHGRGAALA